VAAWLSLNGRILKEISMKLYLAGPDVFLPNAVEVGKVKRGLCRQYGFIGLFPLDNEVSATAGVPLSKAIFAGNIAMLNEADAVIANLTPFRGVSADVGTVFEIGYGFARHKKIYGYSNVRTNFIERIQEFVSGALVKKEDGRLYAADGLAVENFDRFDNLMIAEALLESGENVVFPNSAVGDSWQDMQAFEQCLRIIRARVSASSHVVAAH
jgi:nucleoside 2-deoxyribosyltransferase